MVYGIESGTKVLTEWGFEITAVNIDSKYHPDICCDVMNWEFTRLPRRAYNVITMSPPRTGSSKAKTFDTRNKLGAIAVVKRAFGNNSIFSAIKVARDSSLF